jgi:hypothetical protein
MAGPGQIPGRYNIIIEGAYETFDHQIPVDGFIQRLQDDAIPDEISVVGLGEAFEDGQQAAELAQAIDERANDLSYQNPTVQFVVEGAFHRQGKTYDLRYNGELYPLRDVFGTQIERKGDGDWLVAPF